MLDEKHLGHEALRAVSRRRLGVGLALRVIGIRRQLTPATFGREGSAIASFVRADLKARPLRIPPRGKRER
jgi:hypothetical protein